MAQREVSGAAFGVEMGLAPDGIGVRKVKQKSLSYTEDPPEKISWQDVQFLAQPGMTPDDVMDLQAVDLANLRGETGQDGLDPRRTSRTTSEDRQH